MNIGFIGLGIMGKPIAKYLIFYEKRTGGGVSEGGAE